MKLVLQWVYKSPREVETVFQSEPLSVAQALIIAEDLNRTGRVKSMTFKDQYDCTWLIKELKKYTEEIKEAPQNVVVYFDGGFEHHTNAAGVGCVIYYEQNGKNYRLRKNAQLDSLLSNNEAEYAALHFCLTELEWLDIHHMEVRFLGDSQVVIHQMAGEWPVYEPQFASWAERIDKKLEALHITPQYELIGRKQNTEADRLATQALEGIEISAHLEEA